MKQLIVPALLCLLPLVSAQPAREPVGRAVNLLMVSIIVIIILVVLLSIALIVLCKRKDIGGTKGGIIGFMAGLVVSAISFVTGAGILIGIPFAVLFCDRLYSCQGEWVGMLPSMIIGLVFLTIIFIVIGIVVGRKVKKK